MRMKNIFSNIPKWLVIIVPIVPAILIPVIIFFLKLLSNFSPFGLVIMELNLSQALSTMDYLNIYVSLLGTIATALLSVAIYHLSASDEVKKEAQEIAVAKEYVNSVIKRMFIAIDDYFISHLTYLNFACPDNFFNIDEDLLQKLVIIKNDMPPNLYESVHGILVKLEELTKHRDMRKFLKEVTVPFFSYLPNRSFTNIASLKDLLRLDFYNGLRYLNCDNYNNDNRIIKYKNGSPFYEQERDNYVVKDDLNNGAELLNGSFKNGEFTGRLKLFYDDDRIKEEGYYRESVLQRGKIYCAICDKNGNYEKKGGNMIHEITDEELIEHQKSSKIAAELCKVADFEYDISTQKRIICSEVRNALKYY